MTKLYENIKSLCKANKMSIAELERQLGIPPCTITTWRKGMPLCERVQLVSHYFDVSIDFLIGDCPNPYLHKVNYSESTIKLIKVSEEIQLNKETTEYAVQVLKLLKNLSK